MDKAQHYIHEVIARCPDLATKAKLDQHFLWADVAIERELQALDLDPGEQVAELGAGIGSVAQAFPTKTNLTLVELDPRLANILRQSFAARPRTHVVRGDALQWVRNHHVQALLCNLPWELDLPLFEALGSLAHNHALPRVVVVAAHPALNLSRLYDACPAYQLQDKGLISSGDYWPPQELPSRLAVARRV